MSKEAVMKRQEEIDLSQKIFDMIKNDPSDTLHLKKLNNIIHTGSMATRIANLFIVNDKYKGRELNLELIDELHEKIKAYDLRKLQEPKTKHA